MRSERRELLKKVSSLLYESFQVPLRENTFVGTTVNQAGAMAAAVPQSSVKKSPDDSVSTNGIQEMARVIAQEMLNPVCRIEVIGSFEDLSLCPALLAITHQKN